MTKEIPLGITELLDMKFPDALAIDGIRHADEAWTLIIFDVDYSYSVWLGCLSLDGRWTLSPRPGARVVSIPDAP